MSLVADYTDSDENSDSGNREGGDTGSDSNGRNKNLKLSSSISAIGAQSVKNGGNKGNFLLQEEDSSSSEFDSDGESEALRSRKKRKQASPIKLSNPFRTVTGDVNVSKEESVFRNPFREKEDQRIAVLEHHVKMTDNPETVTTINGKKICWNYRKRKCYLGTQCPFAHDSDVPLTEEQLKEQKLENDQQRSAGGNVNTNRSVNLQLSSATKPSHLPATASVVAGTFDSNAFFSSPHLGGGGDPKRKTEMADDLDELDKQQSNKSKKRVGLTNSLIPAKRALNLYRKTKDK